MLLRQYVSSGMKGLVLFGFIFFSSLLLGGLFYVVHADTANLNLKLTITMPPQCSFSNGSSTHVVDFDEVQQGLIDGVNYKRMPIDTHLSCTGLEKNALDMVLSWNSVVINGVSAVMTDLPNFGIAIYQDSKRLNNKENISFILTNPPNLYAVPVKPSGVMLTKAGEFKGQMIVTLNYQ